MVRLTESKRACMTWKTLDKRFSSTRCCPRILEPSPGDGAITEDDICDVKFSLLITEGRMRH
jgi:hypothetical protein